MILKKTFCQVISGLLILSCLAGCGKNEGQAIVSESQTPQTDQIIKEYRMDYQEISPKDAAFSGAVVEILQMTEEAMYVLASNYPRFCVYRIPYGEELIPEKLPFNLAEGKFQCISVSETAQETYIVCRLREAEGEYWLHAYDRDGNLLWEKEAMDKDPDPDRDVLGLTDMARDKDGNLYLMGRPDVYLFSPEGDFLGTISGPYQYPRNLVVSRKGTVYILSDIDTSAKVVCRYLAELDPVTLTYTESLLEGESPATGQTEDIIYLNIAPGNWTICERNLETETDRELFSLAEYDVVDPTRMLQADEKYIRAVCWKEQYQPIQLLTFTREQHVLDRQMITVLDCGGDDDDLREAASEFNKKSSLYRVELENLTEGGTYSEDELITRLNARISAKDVDMIFLNQRYYDIYREQKVFENLLPYLEDSSTKAEDYMEVLLDPLRQGEELYAIPTKFSIQGYAVKKSSLGGAEIHTMDEFLDYLESHPDIKWDYGGSPAMILDVCMKFGWERFVDLEKGTCNFDSPEFRALMERIASLELDGRSHYREWDQLIGEGADVMPELRIESLTPFATAEKYYGDELEWIGYPGADDSLNMYANLRELLCISAKSGKKEAAFAFWEYYMDHCRRDASLLPARTADFEEKFQAVCTKQYATEEDGSYILDEDGEKIEVPAFRDNFSVFGSQDHEAYDFYALDEGQQQEVRRVVASLRTDTPDGTQIQKLVMEEMTGYLYGKKSLDESVRILQNRVQLYLNEK